MPIVIDIPNNTPKPVTAATIANHAPMLLYIIRVDIMTSLLIWSGLLCLTYWISLWNSCCWSARHYEITFASRHSRGLSTSLSITGADKDRSESVASGAH